MTHVMTWKYAHLVHGILQMTALLKAVTEDDRDGDETGSVITTMEL